jgi:hypothetical protein
MECLRQEDRTWYCGALCWRHLLRRVEESHNVHSRSHAYGRDKIDLTGLSVQPTAKDQKRNATAEFEKLKRGHGRHGDCEISPSPKASPVRYTRSALCVPSHPKLHSQALSKALHDAGMCCYVSAAVLKTVFCIDKQSLQVHDTCATLTCPHVLSCPIQNLGCGFV